MITLLTLLFSAAHAGPSPSGIDSSRLNLPSGPASVRGMAEDPSVNAFSGQVGLQQAAPRGQSVGAIRPLGPKTRVQR